MTSIALLQRDHEASPRLRAVIDAVPGFWVCGVAHTAEDARHLVNRTHPDILVADVRVQDGFVFPLLTELREGPRAPEPHVLVSLMSLDENLLLEALRHGADGYWTHTEPNEFLIAGLRQLAQGESPISPNIARYLLSHFRRPALQPTADTTSDALDSLRLTRAEQELLMWVSQGYVLDEIADHRRINAHDIGRSVRNIYYKLQLDRRASVLSLSEAKPHEAVTFMPWAVAYR